MFLIFQEAHIPGLPTLLPSLFSEPDFIKITTLAPDVIHELQLDYETKAHEAISKLEVAAMEKRARLVVEIADYEKACWDARESHDVIGRESVSNYFSFKKKVRRFRFRAYLILGF